MFIPNQHLIYCKGCIEYIQRYIIELLRFEHNGLNSLLGIEIDFCSHFEGGEVLPENGMPIRKYYLSVA